MAMLLRSNRLFVQNIQNVSKTNLTKVSQFQILCFVWLLSFFVVYFFFFIVPMFQSRFLYANFRQDPEVKRSLPVLKRPAMTYQMVQNCWSVDLVYVVYQKI